MGTRLSTTMAKLGCPVTVQGVHDAWSRQAWCRVDVCAGVKANMSSSLVLATKLKQADLPRYISLARMTELTCKAYCLRHMLHVGTYPRY